MSPAESSDVIVVRETWVRDGLYGGLTIVFAFALIRGLIGASTSAGQVAIAVIFGAVLIVVLTAWVRTRARPDRLEVSSATIRYVAGSGATRPELRAGDGTVLAFRTSRSGRLVSVALVQPSTSAALPLRLFARKPIIQACESRGWTF